MCGICGKLSINSSGINKEVIARMTKTIEHRGPDDQGIYLSEALPYLRAGGNQAPVTRVALGHRRLSIIDLSQAGHQPMTNEDATLWIVYNGEVYNFKELRNNLQAKGHVFKSNTDTEVIIHLYEEFGVGCVKQLRGMFAFAIWDQKKERLLLARDRLGQKPLNYRIKNGELIFASEIKSILQDPTVERLVNTESLHSYLTYQYVPAPETMFEGIKKLPPACILIWEKGNIKIERYWSLSFANKLRLSEDEYCQRTLDLLIDATKIRLISDVPLGVFLSGGIDSSAVVAAMSKSSASPVRTFSIGFQEQSFNELENARLIAKIFNTIHQEHVVKPDALEVLPRLIEHFGEPFADSTSIPTYYLSKLTRSSVTVALNGDAGDESFAGYERYVANKLANYYRMIPAFFRNKIAACFLQRLPESTQKKDFAGRIKRFIGAASLPKERRYAYWMSTFDNALKEKLYSRELQNRLKDIDSHSYLLDTFRGCDAKNFVDSALFVDIMTYLPNDLLVKVDIASMANSLEARSPFLDHKLMEFAARIPAHLKLKGITTKYILKKALTKLLPGKILQQEKSGFALPVGRWFRNEMKNYVYEILLEQKSLRRNYFRQEAIKELLDEHVSGKINHGERIWTLLNLELWHRAFID